MPINGVLPVVSIYRCQHQSGEHAEILLNGNGTYVVQATGLSPGATYYLRVSAAPAPAALRRQLLPGGRLRRRARRLRRSPAARCRHPTSRINTPCMSPRPNCSSSCCPPARRDGSERPGRHEDLRQHRPARVHPGRTGREHRQRRQHPLDARPVPVHFSAVNTSGAVCPDHLSACAGPVSRTRSDRPRRTRRRADVSVPGRPIGQLLLLPQRDLFHDPLRSLEPD